jgi:aminoglycoside phosphotransferase (APT) family kinase protein
MAEWDAEIVVSPELALELIHEQFPELARSVEPLGSGWDNTVYLVDGELVFRFPRRSVAVPMIETEARVLPKLAPHLPLAIPSPEWLGAATEQFPWPFGGYRKVAGRPATDVELSPADRRRAAEPLAAFLRALHAIPTTGLGLPSEDEIGRTDLASRMPLLAERLRGLEDAGVIADGCPWLRLFEAGDLPAPPAHTVTVHGDLSERHVLLDDAHRVCGVIDWGDMHAGDPALDLSILYSFFPAPDRGEFLRVYGNVDARTARAARLHAAFAATSSTLYAHSIGDAGFVPTGLTVMRRVLED